jgi:hypothetical protein
MQRIGLQLRGLAGTDVLQVQQDGGWKSPQCLRAICGDRRRARAVWRSGFERGRVGKRNNAPPVGAFIACRFRLYLFLFLSKFRFLLFSSVRKKCIRPTMEQI